MRQDSLRTDEALSEIYYRHRDTVYRICYSFMRNFADAEDAAQDTFLKLVRYAPAFASPEHEKAWLIRTAGNVCRNMLRRKDRFSDDLDSHPELFGPDDSDARALLQAVLSLPDKYKLPVYLYYYEGYSSVEIAGLLKKPQSTVRTYLGKARQLLKDALTGDRT